MNNDLTYIDILRGELEEKLKPRFSNKFGKIIIQSAANDICESVFVKYEKRVEEYEDLKDSDKNKTKIANYLERVEGDCKFQQRKLYELFHIAPNTLKNFFNDVGEPSIETLHILTLYLGYFGWYDFIDRIEEEGIVPQDIYDILVLSFEGDEADSLSIDLISTLYGNLNNNPRIKKSRKKIDYTKSPKEAHRQARKIGKEQKVSFVIWGHVVKTKNKIFPRITIVNEDINRLLIDENNFTLPFVFNNNMELPGELIEKPILFASFINAFNFYKEGDYKLALFIFEEIENKVNPKEIRLIDLLSLIANTCFYIYMFDNKEYNYRIQAINYYKKILAISPKDFQAYLYLGIIYAKSKEFTRAIEHIEKAINYGAIKRDAYEILGLIFNLKRNFTQAITFFKKSIEEAPEFLNTMRNLALVYKEQGNFEESTKWFKKILELDQNNEDALDDLGLICWERKKYSEAINYFDKIIEINKENHHAWNNKGLVLQDLQRYEDALGCYREALNIKPDFLSALNNLGNTYCDIKEYDKALRSIKEVVKLDPNSFDAYNTLGNIYCKMGDYKRGLDYTKMATKGKQPHIAWHNMGLTYEELGKFDKALGCWKRVVDIEPSFYEGWHSIGSLLSKMEYHKAAIDHYIKAIETKTDYYQAWYGLGSSYFHLKDYKNAISNLKQSIKIEPEFHDAWNNLGLAFYEMGNIEEAFRCYDKANKIDSKNARCWNNVGLAYGKQGNKNKAVECFQKATTINSKFWEAWFNMGTTFFYEKDDLNAFLCFTEVIKIKPDFMHAWIYLGTCHVDNKELQLQSMISFSKDYGNLYLGYIYLANKQNEKAINHFRKGKDNFISKEKFWEEFEKNIGYLKQYRINIDQNEFKRITEEIEK